MINVILACLTINGNIPFEEAEYIAAELSKKPVPKSFAESYIAIVGVKTYYEKTHEINVKA